MIAIEIADLFLNHDRDRDRDINFHKDPDRDRDFGNRALYDLYGKMYYRI